MKNSKTPTKVKKANQVPNNFDVVYEKAIQKSIKVFELEEIGKKKPVDTRLEVIVINNKDEATSYKLHNYQFKVFTWIKVFRDYFGIVLLTDVLGFYALSGLLLLLRNVTEQFQIKLKEAHARIIVLLYNYSPKKSKWIEVIKLKKMYYDTYGKKFSNKELETYLVELSELKIIDFEISESIISLKEKVLICK